MGREIRRVPPNWEHPKNDNGEFRSMLINQINIETIVGKDHDEVVTPELVKAAVESMKNERK